MATADKNVEYLPVDVATIRLETVTSFDLYIRVPPDKYVLYISRENAFTEDALANLVTKKVKRLYVTVEQEDAYREYVEGHLPEIVADPSIAPETKSRIVYQSASKVVQNVFDGPRAESIQRSKEVIGATVSMILNNEEATMKLMQLTAHDYYTYTHSVNVCVFSVCLAKNLFDKISEEDFKRLGVGFVLHDIGKSMVPSRILQKKGPLNKLEWQRVRAHPQHGYQILKDTGHLTDEAGVIALQHHERIDGSGYPKQLKGDRIHQFAQVCALADVFDALTTNRPYGKARSSFDALNLMKTEMSDYFVKEYFEKFVLLLRDKK